MAYIKKEEISEIRKALKKAFPKVKFSVRGDSQYSSVYVSIMKSDIDFNALWEEGSYRKEHQYEDINIYHYEKHYPEHKDFFDKIMKIIKTAPASAEDGREWFDKSDIMTDYFHCAYYINLSVGKWDKPYEMTA